jgi:DNA-binding PadR family transcriptional regulator
MSPLDRGLLILTSLADGDKHGYALMQDIESFADTRLGPGSLYGALERLADDGLVVALPPDDRRRPYRMTGLGAEVLEQELRAKAELARIGLRRLGSRGE